MVSQEFLPLLVGALGLGFLHGIEPGHGWPLAAAYAFERSNRWIAGFVASLTLGVGHLISSLAMVGLYFYVRSFFDLAEANAPLTVLGVRIGGPVSIVAGVVLIALGLREYFGGHSHSHSHSGSRSGSNADHNHEQSRHTPEQRSGGVDHTSDDDHRHRHGPADEGGSTGNGASDNGVFGRFLGFLPFVGEHTHRSLDETEATERGIIGFAGFAVVLGFAHEEEFQIIALCTGSNYCFDLMSAYALAVITSIVGLTLLLIAGYERYQQRVERYTPYLPALSAVILCLMGLGFVSGVL